MAGCMLSLTPFRGVIKDYFLVCDNYYKAIRTAPPSQIEALDMGRRALHDEGARCCRSGWRARSKPISTPPGGFSP